MLNTTVTFNNITFTNGTNTLMVGDIRAVTPLPGAIDIKPVGEQVHSYIILQKGDDDVFKKMMETSPVRPFDITLFDHNGQIACKYAADRRDNTSGTVKITSSKDLLSEITFPPESSSQTYLVITRYEGLDQLTLLESKQSLVSQDLERLRQNTNTKKINLFISDEINKEITSLGIDLTETFQRVFPMPVGKQIRYLVEYLVGKSVSGSKPSYQGMIKFGSGNLDYVPDKYQITYARFMPVDSNCAGLTSAIRRNGRIQINSESNVAHSRFFIMLKHPENPNLTISDEMTGCEFPITYRTTENMPDITEANLIAIIDSYFIFEKMVEKDSESLKSFISGNYVEAGKYIFASPLAPFNELKSDSETSSIIIEYGCFLQNHICSVLINYAAMTTNKRFKPNKRPLLFGDLDTMYLGSQARFNGGPQLTRLPEIRQQTTCG